jgi:hypothetical protein
VHSESPEGVLRFYPWNGSSVGLFSDVKYRVPGWVLMVCRIGIPFAHLQDSKNQKTFCQI